MKKKKIFFLVLILSLSLFSSVTLLSIPEAPCNSDENCGNVEWWHSYPCTNQTKCGSTGPILMYCVKCEP